MRTDHDVYLCFAWGETDYPCAAIVPDRAAVRQFLIDQWLGEEGEDLDEAMVRFDGGKDDYDAWDGTDSIDWEFEIGGVRITKIYDCTPRAASTAQPPELPGAIRSAKHRAKVKERSVYGQA